MELHSTLRGVTLAGIDSVSTDHATKSRYWDLLAGPWKLEWPKGYVQETPLAEMTEQVRKMLASETVGRILVQIPG